MGDQFRLAALIVGFTVLSGLADAQGFLHASRIWTEHGADWAEAAKSALGFWTGVGAYWLALRFMGELGIVSPEIQTTLWFGVTIASVALITGQFATWRLIDQLIALAVLTGIGWLLWRTGSEGTKALITLPILSLLTLPPPIVLL